MQMQVQVQEGMQVQVQVQAGAWWQVGRGRRSAVRSAGFGVEGTLAAVEERWVGEGWMM